MKNIIVLLLLLLPVSGFSQDHKEITLEYCYQQVQNEFPLAKKLELQNLITDLNVRLQQTGLYPEINITGSASYQSDVTEVPFAGASAPEFSKDHYNFSVDITQPIYDGGRTTGLKLLDRKAGDAARTGVEVELRKVRKQVEQIYFGILLLQKQKETADLLLKDLNEQISVVQSLVANGVLLNSNSLILRAEILKVKQRSAEVSANIRSGHEVLSELIGEDITVDTRLILPVSEDSVLRMDVGSHRPELRLFEERQEVLKSRIGTIQAEKKPVVSAFAKTAYARPGLDAFDDDLQLFWVVGVRAQWSFRNWSNADRKAQVLQIQQDLIEKDRDAFTRQLNASLRQTGSVITALKEKIKLDEEVLELRTEVVNEKKSQLTEGVITSTEYVTELNALNRARLDLEIHQIQLTRAYQEYLTIQGISWK